MSAQSVITGGQGGVYDNLTHHIHPLCTEEVMLELQPEERSDARQSQWQNYVSTLVDLSKRFSWRCWARWTFSSERGDISRHEWSVSTGHFRNEMTLFNLKSKLIIWWLDFLCPGPSRNMLRYIKSVSPQREQTTPLLQGYSCDGGHFTALLVPSLSLQ